MSEYIIKAAEWAIDYKGESLFKGCEEIVRCRDCVGLYETWDGWECERFSGEYHRAEPDGFCAWAERRTNDN